MKCHQTEQSTHGRSAAGYSYPKGRLLPSCLDRKKFTRFQETKTSADKRFYNMSAKPIYRICAAKLQHFFDSCKKNEQKSLFFHIRIACNKALLKNKPPHKKTGKI